MQSPTTLMADVVFHAGLTGMGYGIGLLPVAIIFVLILRKMWK